MPSAFSYVGLPLHPEKVAPGSLRIKNKKSEMPVERSSARATLCGPNNNDLKKIGINLINTYPLGLSASKYAIPSAPPFATLALSRAVPRALMSSSSFGAPSFPLALSYLKRFKSSCE